MAVILYTIAMATLCSTLKKKTRQANEKSSEFLKGAYRDGVKREETSQGKELADCDTPLQPPLHTDDVIPILLPW